VQAVVVTVSHVAERHAIEREAELVLVEAAHGDARGPFVRAIGIRGLKIDARKVLDRLERARASRQLVNLFGTDRLHLARLAATEHDDLFESGRAGLRSVSCRSSEHVGDDD
jgi:hypothetical protein